MVAKKTVLKTKSVLPPKGKRVEEDSSDEESTEEFKSATKSKTLTHKGKKQKTLTTKPVVPNVIYIGHLPKHCEERELIGFLKQFGSLTQLRLCRSHKTGGSKGYAFAKFQDPEVAAIVAETLNNYLLSQKKLVSHVLAPEQIHRKLFASKTRTVFQRKMALRDGPKTTEKMEEISKQLIEREQKKRDKLKAMGIDFDFPGYEGSKNKIINTQEEEEEEVEKVSAKKTKKRTKEVEATPTKESPPKKRKRSFDEESANAEKDSSDKTQSEKKPKKKKKDKKRRKSDP